MSIDKMITKVMNEIPTNLTWDEVDMWKGWTYNIKKNRYYFDDIGHESITTLWDSEFLNQAYI